MKWMNNLQLLAKENKVGNCPFCNSNNTDSAFSVVNQESHMGHGSIWCNDCRHAYHISRILITDNLIIKSIPSDLIY